MGSGTDAQWKVAQEVDRALSFYSYTDGGAYQGLPFKMTRDGAIYTQGLIYGRGGGAGLGQITVSTSDPSGGENGDLWMKVA